MIIQVKNERISKTNHFINGKKRFWRCQAESSVSTLERGKRPSNSMTTPIVIRSPPTFNYSFPRSWTSPDLFPENHPWKQNNTTILPKNQERVQMLPQKRNKEVIFCFKKQKIPQESLQFETELQNRQILLSAARTGYVVWLPPYFGWLKWLAFVFLQVILSMFLWQCSLSLLEISTRSIWCVHFSFNLSGNC